VPTVAGDSRVEKRVHKNHVSDSLVGAIFLTRIACLSIELNYCPGRMNISRHDKTLSISNAPMEILLPAGKSILVLQCSYQDILIKTNDTNIFISIPKIQEEYYTFGDGGG